MAGNIQSSSYIHPTLLRSKANLSALPLLNHFPGVMSPILLAIIILILAFLAQMYIKS